MKAYKYFPQTSPVDSLTNRKLTVPSPEEKSLLEAFGTIFHSIDDQTFRVVVQAEISHLHKLVFKHHPLLKLTIFFLASERSSAPFCDMMIQYLKDQMEMVGSSDAVTFLILRRLFKDSFMSVALYPTHNLKYLNLHINHIITWCLQLHESAEQPSNYFELLLVLFSSIGSEKCAALHETAGWLESIPRQSSAQYHDARNLEPIPYGLLCI
jgi:transformation/transcription domain-associated protein